ncbi:MAG: TonB-dependent receptor [Bacteroidales bacterium]
MVFLCLGLAGLDAQTRVTLSGTVSDAESGEKLIGATVYVAGTSLGTSSNSYGFYSLTVPAGNLELVCSYIGYEEMRRSLELKENQMLDLKLQEASTRLEEVTVMAEASDHQLRTTDIGVEKLDVASISRVPVLLGERDILKTLQLLPGISTVSEGSTGFSVRGGSMDQNLILLDEAPVYSASHLMGFFSVFPADAVKDVSVYKGGIPARYGGRASAVVDIQMNDGNNQHLTGNGGIGLISSRLTLEGPLVRDRGSFIVSGRRSYADLVARSVGLLEEDITLYFYDLTAKLNYKLNDRNRVFLSAYMGRDDFGFEEFGTDWGNTTTTFRWNHLFGSRLFSNTSVLYSNYDYAVNLAEFLKMGSGIEDVGLKQDFSWYVHPDHTVRFGVQSTFHRFNPGELRPVDPDSSMIPEVLMPGKQALVSGLYASGESKAGPRLSFQYGLRFSLFQQMGEGSSYVYDANNERIDSTVYGSGEVMQTYMNLEPRLSMNYRLGERSSVKFSYNRMAQYLHLLSNSTSGMPTDTWVPSSSNIRPILVNQVSGGYFRNFLENRVELSLELYYKDLRNTTDYEDGTQTMFNEDVEAYIVSGRGRSYGAEFMLRKQSGRVNGWLSYTLARTEQRMDGINFGHWYPTTYDKTHDVSLVLNWDITDRLSLSGAWVYYTGNAVTFPSGKYEFDGQLVSYYTERNGYRMPDYHRLDLGLHLAGKKEKKFRSSWDLSAYNVYNRHNAYLIDFRESETVPGTTEAVKLSLFGIVPSLSWNFEF